MSDFIKRQIEERLKELRFECGLQRLHLRNAHGPRWSGCQRRNAENPDSWELHWENLQAQAQQERPKEVAAADKALADFIAEHRAIMGPDWIGNDHGRLCWSPYVGGRPIEQHYCQKSEGHANVHADEAGGWPREVTNDYEWHRLCDACEHTTTYERDANQICAVCGREIQKQANQMIGAPA